MRWAGHVVLTGEERNAYRFLIVKTEVKRPVGKPNDIKMDVREIGRTGFI
jgi:hypothetical protein